MQSVRSPVDEAVRRLVRRFRSQLSVAGVVQTHSGALRWSGGSLFGHSDFGPPEQDKSGNEDFLVLWTAADQDGPATIPWVAALADGVTSSCRSKLAAELVCWCGVSALLAASADCQPPECGIQAVRQAVKCLRLVGRVFRRNKEELQPADEFPATWDYRLHSGTFLQTTLTLAWFQSNRVHIARVGDGGAALLLCGDGTAKGPTEVLLPIDVDAHQVHALGPDTDAMIRPDDSIALEMPAKAALALYTDGMARVVQTDPTLLCDEFDRAMAESPVPRDVAARVVKNMMATEPDQLRDNLTVVFVTSDRP